MYVCLTHVDAETGVICTQQRMRTGPSFPKVNNFNFLWSNSSEWPIDCLPDGTYSSAPRYYGTCDEDSNIYLPGVICVLTEEEFLELKSIEHQARKPYESWVGNLDDMSWRPPVDHPLGSSHTSLVDNNYYWDESSVSWRAITRVEYI